MIALFSERGRAYQSWLGILLAYKAPNPARTAARRSRSAAN
jgi:hypothetical protein